MVAEKEQQRLEGTTMATRTTTETMIETQDVTMETGTKLTMETTTETIGVTVSFPSIEMSEGGEEDYGRGSLTETVHDGAPESIPFESEVNEEQRLPVPESFRDDINETLERPIPIRRPHDDAGMYPSLNTVSIQQQALPEGSVRDPSKKNSLTNVIPSVEQSPAKPKRERWKEYERFLNKHTQDLGAIVTHYRIPDEAVDLLLGVFHAFLEDLSSFKDQRPELPKNRNQLQSVLNMTVDRVVSVCFLTAF
jgi:hypothetical protein